MKRMNSFVNVIAAMRLLITPVWAEHLVEQKAAIADFTPQAEVAGRS
jgi:hypothetical protein